MKVDSEYYLHLFREILKSINNEYNDNYDHLRFGTLERKSTLSIKNSLKRKLNDKGYFHESNLNNIANKIGDAEWVGNFAYLYNILEDSESKNLLIKIVAFRLLGHEKVKLPLSSSKYWKDLKMIEFHQSKDESIDIDFMKFKMPLTDLSFLGLPIKIYYTSSGINIDFIIKQYELHRNGIHIQAEPGEVVIDGGGCFGDTALYFSNKVQEFGGVHVFEFIPDNIKIFEKNISINPQFKSVINLIENPLWVESGVEVYYQSNGPGSRVSFQLFEGYSGKTKTLSIDDYVDNAGLKRVDFIKMDIEGAERNALAGAKKTLKVYKPKLAIALYHSTEDFEVIPKFISGLDLGYKFYLSHATIFEEETMLFASIN